MPLIRSISGLRATLGDALSPEIISVYATAFATMLPEGPIVVGRDGRPSGTWIESIVLGSLAACGRNVLHAGMVPTPTVQLLCEHSDAAGAIIITASHNPAEWNGLKFLWHDGVFLDAAQNEQLWHLVDKGPRRLRSDQQSAELIELPDAIDRHIQSVLSLPIFNTDALARIRSRSPRIVVDAVNCSGSVAVPTLLRQLGAEVIELFCDGSGVFPHTPEPLTQNLTQLAEAVRAHKADLGVAVDPDADRLVLIDERGEAIGEEKTVMLAIEAVMRNSSLFGAKGQPTAVVNLSTSRMAMDAAEHHGGRCALAPVGEINVVRAMQSLRAIVGGEGSGGVIVPACHSGRDSLVGCALVLWLMGNCSNDEWHQLTRSQPYAMIKTKREVAQRPESFHPELSATELNECTVNTSDGVRIDWPDRWVQLRASNTEAIVRIIAEAPTSADAEVLIARAETWLR